MEGLIPYVYRAIVHYKKGGPGHIRSWLAESPSASYIRLPGDSGRFQVPAFGFGSPASSAPSKPASSTVQIIQSPVYRRRVVA